MLPPQVKLHLADLPFTKAENLTVVVCTDTGDGCSSTAEPGSPPDSAAKITRVLLHY